MKDSNSLEKQLMKVLDYYKSMGVVDNIEWGVASDGFVNDILYNR